MTDDDAPLESDNVAALHPSLSHRHTRTHTPTLFTCIAKLNVMNSHTGRRPANAAPTAMPVNPASVIGVSLTRSGPYFCSRPRVILFYFVFVCFLLGCWVVWLCVVSVRERVRGGRGRCQPFGCFEIWHRRPASRSAQSSSKQRRRRRRTLYAPWYSAT